MKKRIHMHLDNDIFKSFKDFCTKKQMNFSNKIEELMNKELTNNNQKPSLVKYAENKPPRFEAVQPVSYIKQQIQQPIKQPIQQPVIQPTQHIQPRSKPVPTIAQLRYRKGL